MEVRSRLTGNRLGALPFSDECPPLCDDEVTAGELMESAMRIRDERGLRFFEMRGAPVLADGSTRVAPESAGLARTLHFFNYRIPLTKDADAVFQTFKKRSVRQVINKGFRLGVAVRRGDGHADLREFYRLYVYNRKGHGIPPQPFELFSLLFARLQADPQAALYLAEHEGKAVAALVTICFKGLTFAKYEGIDHAYRQLQPVYPLIWKSIEESALRGDRCYDMGRTAMDNPGLNSFKSHWGADQTELPYFFYPPGHGVSVVASDSWKYRLFTGAFRRMPYGLSVAAGSRLFRHFG
jgi:CelD/BcsL family acetyltransferase involved in cellulose biosynthesis